MTSTKANRIREYRVLRGWSQAELAERTGISRTAISAIEGCRLVPSVAAAMALAKSLGATVEELFDPERANEAGEPTVRWASTASDGPIRHDGPYWQAEVGGRIVRYPASATPMITPLADGQGSTSRNGIRPDETLVLACCDPAAGLLANLFEQGTGFRLLVVPSSTGESLRLLSEGLVHLAGMHLATVDEPDHNVRHVRDRLGSGYHLLRIADWQEGIAAHPSLKLRSVRGAVRSRLTWVGREPGSGARDCLDRLLGERATPRCQARHHRGVAEAVRAGWADAGICVRLPSEEAGLDFVAVQQESYEVCLPSERLADPRVRAFLRVVRSKDYRELLASLPGYDTTHTGSLHSVDP